MTHHPDRAAARYEGRLLPRPDDEIQDQGLGFDLGTLLGRRQVLRALGLGVVAVGVAACGTGPMTSTSTTSSAAGDKITEIPDETAGPFPGDGSNGVNVLTESGIVRSDIRSSFGLGSATAKGVPMALELTITDIAHGNTPFKGVAVYVWHCNRDGEYSLYSEGLENENYLRGVQIADADGKVRYTSIFPACYAGRWPHIHIEVYPDQPSITVAGTAIATSQVALPGNICGKVYAQPGYEQSATNLARVTLATDNVFGDDSAATQLATVSGDVAPHGYSASLAIGVDTTTRPRGSAPVGRDRVPAEASPGARPGSPGGAPPSGARPSGPPPSGTSS